MQHDHKIYGNKNHQLHFEANYWKGSAREKHKKIIDAIKRQPKPNLPKSEMSEGPTLEKYDPKGVPSLDAGKVKGFEAGFSGANSPEPISNAIGNAASAVGNTVSNWFKNEKESKKELNKVDPKTHLAGTLLDKNLEKGKIEDMRQQMAQDQGVKPKSGFIVPKVKQDPVTGNKTPKPIESGILRTPGLKVVKSIIEKCSALKKKV